MTGAYGDEDVHDEWAWAATELYVTTKDDHYWTAGHVLAAGAVPIATWSQVRLLAYYTLLRFAPALTAVGRQALP